MEGSFTLGKNWLPRGMRYICPVSLKQAPRGMRERLGRHRVGRTRGWQPRPLVRVAGWMDDMFARIEILSGMRARGS
jgi:hypothetical protein